MNAVRYRSISGWPGYRVGDDGTVWTSKLGANGGWRKMRTPANKQTGYARLTLSHENVQREFAVHALVLTAFAGPCPEGMLCRHLDGDKTNNASTNLKWGTHTENEADKAAHGKRAVGSAVSGSKLTEASVKHIRARFAGGETIRGLAREFAINRSTMVAAIYGRTFANVPVPDYSARPKYHKSWTPKSAASKRRAPKRKTP